MTRNRRTTPALPRHTCWALSGEHTCFECARDLRGEYDGGDMYGMWPSTAADPLEDVAPSFDQDAYYDGVDL